MKPHLRISAPKVSIIAALLFSLGNASEIIDLWPEGKIPGPHSHTDGEERDLTRSEDRLIADKPIIKLGHVSTPQLEVFLPPAEKRNGTGIVICPGGGFSILAWDLEGTEVATWLNEIGIAAAVLKYRVPTREHGEEGTTAPKKALGPMMDVQRALSLFRGSAETWGVDTHQIGALGFSAGGQIAALTAVAAGKRAYEAVDKVDEFSCAPDFAMLIYPGGLADAKTGELNPFYSVTKETPPMFFVHAADDRVTCLSSSALFTEMKKAGASAELHIYARGGHGYGMRPTDLPVTRWPERAEDWLRDLEFLTTIETGAAFEDSLVSFGETQAARKKAGKPLQQFSVAEPNAGIFHAEAVLKTYVGRLLEKDTFAGIKGAVVGKGGQDAFQIEAPLTAVLFQSGWHAAKNQAEIPIREGENPGIETELGIILAKPVTKKLSDIAELKRHVRSVVPVIELPAGKMDFPQKPKAIDLIAANVGSDHYIVGEEHTDLEIDLDVLPIQLFRGEEVINDTTGGAAHRGQWWNFLYQINHGLELGYSLEAGNLVITGALGEIRKDGAGEYRATFGELGEIQFSLK